MLQNLLVSSSADSTNKIWDFTKNPKFPINCFYDSDSAIISSDLRQTDDFHICLNEEGYVYLRNIANEKEFKSIKAKRKNYNFVKFNPFNKNQFYLGSEESLSIFDLRENKEIEVIKKFGDCVDIFCDSRKYLVTFRDSIRLFDKNTLEEKNLIFEYPELSFANLCFYNEKFDSYISGNENGDFIYSMNGDNNILK